MNEDIVKQIKTLPPMPDSVRQIQLICNNPSSSVANLIKVVEKDPPLTANLLKAANSPLYGFSREITTIAQAVALFGMATVKGFAIASAAKSSFKIDLSPYNLNVSDFVRNSEEQSGFMVRWFGKVNRSMLDILAPTSFLLEIGIVVLAEHAKRIEKTKELQSALANRGNRAVNEIEREFFGITSCEVSALLFEHWNFESMMTSAIHHVQNPAQAPEDVRPYTYPLAVIRNFISLYDAQTPERLGDIRRLLAEAKLDEALFFEIFEAEKQSMS
ncbi:MAG: HDOD domain-containing protein [Wolinella sp.]